MASKWALEQRRIGENSPVMLWPSHKGTYRKYVGERAKARNAERSARKKTSTCSASQPAPDDGALDIQPATRSASPQLRARRR